MDPSPWEECHEPAQPGQGQHEPCPIQGLGGEEVEIFALSMADGYGPVRQVESKTPAPSTANTDTAALAPSSPPRPARRG